MQPPVIHSLCADQLVDGEQETVDEVVEARWARQRRQEPWQLRRREHGRARLTHIRMPAQQARREMVVPGTQQPRRWPTWLSKLACATLLYSVPPTNSARRHSWRRLPAESGTQPCVEPWGSLAAVGSADS